MTRFALLLIAMLAAATPALGAEHASQPIGADALAAAVTREIASRQPLGNARLELDNPGLRLYADAPADAPLAVESLTIDARNGRIVAFVAAEDGERIRVTGRLRQMIEMPVLNRPVPPGETIAAGDIDRITVPADRFLQGYLADAGELIGKTPRRALRPNEPLRAADLQVPIIVRKGELVTIVLETPSLQLTTQGKAVEDGGKGATIRVTNVKSGRVIEAVVAGPNTVTVTVPQVAAR